MLRNKRISLRTALGLMFVSCAVITALISISLQYYFARQHELNNTLERYKVLSKGVSTYLSDLQTLATSVTRSGAQLVKLIGTDNPDQRLFIPLSKLLESDPSLHSIFVAKPNDDFYQLINLDSEEVRKSLNVNQGEKWLLVTHLGQKQARRKVSTYYDHDFIPIKREVEFSHFVPTQRGWFHNATTDQVYSTSPYLFSTLQVSGETYSLKLAASQTVVGVDILLSAFESQLTSRFITDIPQTSVEAFVFHLDGQLIATNKAIDVQQRLPYTAPIQLSESQRTLIESLPEIKVSNQNDWGPLDHAVAGRPNGYTIDLFKLVSAMTGIHFVFVNGLTWNELVEDFKQGHIDILQSISKIESLEGVGVVGHPLFQGNYTLLVNPLSSPLDNQSILENGTIGLLKGWSLEADLKRSYPNLNIIWYGSIHDAIEALHQQQIDAVLDLEQVLTNKVKQHYRHDLITRPIESPLLPNTFHYVINDELEPVAEIIDLALSSLTTAQLFALQEKWFGGTTHQSSYSFLPYETLIELAKAPQHHNTVQLITLNDEEKYLFLTPLESRHGRYFAAVFAKSHVMNGVNQVALYAVSGSLLILVMLIPFAWLMAKPIAVPINNLKQQVGLVKKRQYDQVTRVTSYIEEVDQLGLAIVKGTEALQGYERRQAQFFESVIQLIAKAIDEKSPYTANHCNRVPEIALLLADAAERSSAPPFQHFHFANEAERREFRIAAWLHDCGKITTPEYVVDKGTKLEANYNRIHEIRMRFEVLWRDEQIKALKKQCATHHVLLPEQSDMLCKLREEFAFIANANIGSESLSQKDLERLTALAEKEWWRYFDDGQGLSPIERSRHTPTMLPFKEQLLSDKPQHIIERESPLKLDPNLGITMSVPTHLYNHGELYNLSITRGTLTKEERFKINEHMISGIKMLESIPFPRELKRVPRYATTHHEKLNGQGYPRGLNAEQLSMPERILAVADIFEALTAADRPYKAAKTLSETIEIMHKMVLSNHIDRDVFDLLLSSGVYLQYAEQFLPERLIDKVDLSQYLAPSTPAPD